MSPSEQNVSSRLLYERLLEEEAALRHISFHGAPWDSGVMMADLDVIDIAGLADLIREAVCNVSEGDWTKQRQEWQDAAVRCRDQYHALLASNPASEPKAAGGWCERHGGYLGRRCAICALEASYQDTRDS